MAQILHGLQMPHSEKPHVFPEATYDVAVRNTCGFSTFNRLLELFHGDTNPKKL